MHTSSYDHHVTIGKGELTFQPIRSLEGFENVLRFTVSVALFTFRKVLEVYRNGELPAFSRKYLENWQKEFMDFPPITFNVQSSRL